MAESQSQVKLLEYDMKSQAKTSNQLEGKLKIVHSSSYSLYQKFKLYNPNERIEATSNTS